MFEFLKKISGKGAAVQESQRQTVARALGEINAVLEGLEEKPVLSYDAENGRIALELPEQMPDETLALPAPEAGGTGEKTQAKDAKPGEAAEDAAEGDGDP